MRKQLCVAIAVLGVFATISASAQTARRGRTSIKAGPVFSSFWGEKQEADFNNHTGLSAGIEMSFPLGKSFAIQPELLYTQKGTTLSSIENDDRFQVQYHLDYIEIPLLASFTTASEGMLHGRFYIGPFVAALVREKIDATYAGIPLSEHYLKDLRPDEGFAPADAGGIIGAGVLLYLTDHMALTVDIRLAVSAVPLDWDAHDFVANRALSLSAGLAL